ncbi:delta-like protein 4 [Denticeps clupeoides]|uniref:Delta-like protein n=1 Tax=Denticeps clupeoides TaxID=299321 RepID=A0AAY4BFT7_9TELE|nr:delta-like protein 4 [Denticeps clupeoides]
MAVWCLVVLGSVMTAQVYGSGVFELDLQRFQNDRGLLASGRTCAPDCRTFFRVCLKNYQAVVRPGDCVFGSDVTPVLGSNSFAVAGSAAAAGEPLRLLLNFGWPGAFSLVVEAWYAPKDDVQLDTTNPELLISSFAIQRNLAVGAEWVQDVQAWRQTALRFSYRFVCSDNYYGDSCSRTCTPRDDRFGHYSCDSDGQKSCLPGWSGKYCEEPVCLEGCSSRNGNCSRPGECVCKEGWQGTFCDVCTRHPACKHGTCQQPGQCACAEGWGGLFCDQDLNYCTHHKPCLNGTCMNTGQGSYTCTCHPGFTGVDCERAVTECDSEPCLNGAQCLDLENGYRCACPKGFEGTHCEHKVLTCADSPCFHTGRCHEKGNGRSYVCECSAGFTGLNCEKKVDKCTTHPCTNGGQCVVRGNARKCNCRSGFAGPSCEVNINECATSPCANGSTCMDRINGYACLCARGFGGRNCELVVDLCVAKPCLNGGTCASGSGCACPALYSGPQCEIHSPNSSSTPSPYTETQYDPHPKEAVFLGIFLVVVFLLLCMFLIVLRHIQKRNQEEDDDSDAKNNLSDFQKDNLISALTLKNTNKEVDLEVDCMNEKINYKHNNYQTDYKSLSAYKDEFSQEEKCHPHEKCLEDKKPLSRIYRETPGSRISTICSRDSMYQSVFVLTEEKNEYIIATEV